MSTRIITGDADGRPGAAFFDSVTGLAFGHIFESGEEAEAFLEYLTAQGVDPRALDADVLTDRWLAWRARWAATGGYPAGWPTCPGCAMPALDGHITCGDVGCNEAGRR
jgi:hypothetical protein